MSHTFENILVNSQSCKLLHDGFFHRYYIIDVSRPCLEEHVKPSVLCPAPPVVSEFSFLQIKRKYSVLSDVDGNAADGNAAEINRLRWIVLEEGSLTLIIKKNITWRSGRVGRNKKNYNYARCRLL